MVVDIHHITSKIFVKFDPNSPYLLIYIQHKIRQWKNEYNGQNPASSQNSWIEHSPFVWEMAAKCFVRKRVQLLPRQFTQGRPSKKATYGSYNTICTWKTIFPILFIHIIVTRLEWISRVFVNYSFENIPLLDVEVPRTELVAAKWSHI